MQRGLISLKLVYKHVVPFAVAIRLVTLTMPSSLAIAATHLPNIEGSIAVGNMLPITQVQNVLSETDFLQETNAARVIAGLQPLHLDDKLIEAAQNKASDMIAKNYWDHYSPTGEAPWDFISQVGYTYHFAGENLARGFKTAHGITDAWLASPSHRANILNKNYTQVGFATTMGTNDQGQRVLITVQLFGAP